MYDKIIKICNEILKTLDYTDMERRFILEDFLEEFAEGLRELFKEEELK